MCSSLLAGIRICLMCQVMRRSKSRNRILFLKNILRSCFTREAIGKVRLATHFCPPQLHVIGECAGSSPREGASPRRGADLAQATCFYEERTLANQLYLNSNIQVFPCPVRGERDGIGSERQCQTGTIPERETHMLGICRQKTCAKGLF